MSYADEVWQGLETRQVCLATVLSRISEEVNLKLFRSFLDLIWRFRARELFDVDLGKIISSFVCLAFPAKTSTSKLFNNLPNFHRSTIEAQGKAVDFLNRVITELYELDDGNFATFLEVTENSQWLDCDTLRRFFIYCINVIANFKPEIGRLKALSEHPKWILSKEPNLTPAIVSLLVPFAAGEVTGFIRHFLSKGDNINWRFALIFCSVFMVCLEDDAKTLFKDMMSTHMGDAIENENESAFLSGLLVVRHVCNEQKVTSFPFASYRGWFEHNFAFETSSLASTKKDFTTLCKYLTALMPYETSSAIRAHLNCQPFLPAQCRQSWSDYLNLSRTRLSDLGTKGDVKTAPIFGNQITDAKPDETQESLEIDNDIRESILAFVTSGKIPAKVLEASVFRRTYFEAQFLPRLMDLESDLTDVDVKGRQSFITELDAKSKIPKSLRRQFFGQVASPVGKNVRTPSILGKRRHP